MNLSPAQLNSGRDKQYYSPVWLTNKLGNNVTFFSDQRDIDLKTLLVPNLRMFLLNSFTAIIYRGSVFPP